MEAALVVVQVNVPTFSKSLARERRLSLKFDALLRIPHGLLARLVALLTIRFRTEDLDHLLDALRILFT